jgi:hypothetical protein
MVTLAVCIGVAESNHSNQSVFLANFTELVQSCTFRLSAETRQRITTILTDPALDTAGAEDLISRLAEDDEQIAELWDQVQREEPDARRGPDIVSPLHLGRGATHNWICPVKGCPTPAQPGLGWGTVSGATHCAVHGTALEPVRISDA